MPLPLSTVIQVTAEGKQGKSFSARMEMSCTDGQQAYAGKYSPIRAAVPSTTRAPNVFFIIAPDRVSDGAQSAAGSTSTVRMENR